MSAIGDADHRLRSSRNVWPSELKNLHGVFAGAPNASGRG